GCGGITIRDSQAGSADRSELRMAVTGRQKLYLYLFSNPAITASAIAMLSSAKNRALSTRLSFLAADTARATAFNGGTSDPAQWIAIAVCSLVRTVLFLEPKRFTSSKSFAKAALSNAGGPTLGHSLALVSTNGFTFPQCGRMGFMFIGGVGWETPRPLPQPYHPLGAGAVSLRRGNNLSGPPRPAPHPSCLPGPAPAH